MLTLYKYKQFQCPCVCIPNGHLLHHALGRTHRSSILGTSATAVNMLGEEHALSTIRSALYPYPRGRCTSVSKGKSTVKVNRDMFKTCMYDHTKCLTNPVLFLVYSAQMLSSRSLHLQTLAHQNGSLFLLISCVPPKAYVR